MKQHGASRLQIKEDKTMFEIIVKNLENEKTRCHFNLRRETLAFNKALKDF